MELAIDSMTRSDLLEIIDARAGNKTTIITSQLPVEHWHARIGDAIYARFATSSNGKGRGKVRKQLPGTVCKVVMSWCALPHAPLKKQDA